MNKNAYLTSVRGAPSLSLLRILLLSMLLLCMALQPAHAERKKKILVLHSYHQGLMWTDNITTGIQEVFAPLHAEYEVYYEYLDSKRNGDSKYLTDIASFISLKNKDIEYEVIISVDNNALDMLNQGKIHFKGNPPIIFTGINFYTPQLIANLKHVTGVIELTDHIATIQIMHKLHPQTDTITVILDRTASGKRIREDFRKIEHQFPNTKFRFLREFLLSDIPEIVKTFSDNELLYILIFNRDSEGNFISYAESIEALSKYTDIPIYGSWDFYLGKGIVGGNITSGEQQGRDAAQLALRILQGENIDNIEIIKDSPTWFMFDNTYIQQYHVDQTLLPKESIIINQPLTWVDKNSTLLLNIFVFLFICALFLYFYVRRQNQLQRRYAAHLKEQVALRTEKLKESNDRLQHLSEIDGLTHLYNRRYFDTTLRQQLRQHQGDKTPLTLMICDIDYFKRYNDSYGHIAGDECIKRVAKILQASCMRTNDTVARYGGEEFSIILPATSLAHAERVAARICNNIIDADMKHNRSKISDRITISIGVAAIIPDENTSTTDLTSLADKALYMSKNGGRNRFTVLARWS